MTERVSGRRPGPQHREELVRIWDALDHENRKLLIFTARALAQRQGVLGPEAPLVVMGGEEVPGATREHSDDL